MFETSEADPLVLWARRLARKVAPGETDIAVDLALDYAAGDSQGDRPIPPPRADPASSAAASSPFLPCLWQALDAAYPVLRALLSDPVVGNVVAIAGPVLAQRRTGRRGTLTVSPAARWTSAAIDRVRDGLASAGLPSAEAEQLADDVVEELLTDPVSAADFLDRLRARS